MAGQSQEGHDQRLKALLKQFAGQFFALFLPDWAGRLDFARVEWVDKEVFLDPPSGAKRVLDLVGKVPLADGAEPPRAGMKDIHVAAHIEVESRLSAEALKPRVYQYHNKISADLGVPVLPVALLLNVALDGVGWAAEYELPFWGETIAHFRYPYVGLPGLGAEDYVNGEHVLGAALSTTMRVPAGRKAELYADGLRRIAASGTSDFQRYLLAECLETYAELSDDEKSRADRLLDTEPY